MSDLYEDEFSICAAVEDGEQHLATLHHAFGPLSAECDGPDGGRNKPCCDHVAAVGLYYLADALR